jgi:hypothetical protein
MIGTAICLADADFARLKKHLARAKVPHGLNSRHRRKTSETAP